MSSRKIRDPFGEFALEDQEKLNQFFENHEEEIKDKALAILRNTLLFGRPFLEDSEEPNLYSPEFFRET